MKNRSVLKQTVVPFDLHNVNGLPLSSEIRQSRRRFLRLAVAAALVGAMPSLVMAHGDIGAVRPPLPMPDLMLTRHDGKRVSLRSILNGKATAMQFMFTGCTQICPLQGALFSSVQTQLQQQSVDKAQLLSVSIDALGDDPRALRGWLKKFNAGPRWLAAVLTAKELDTLRVALDDSGDQLDQHTGRIYLFDKNGMLVWRTEDLPTATDIARQLRLIAAA